jgi:hypothetical protein
MKWRRESYNLGVTYQAVNAKMWRKPVENEQAQGCETPASASLCENIRKKAVAAGGVKWAGEEEIGEIESLAAAWP